MIPFVWEAWQRVFTEAQTLTDLGALGPHRRSPQDTHASTHSPFICFHAEQGLWQAIPESGASPVLGGTETVTHKEQI